MTDDQYTVNREEAAVLAKLAGIPIPAERREQMQRTMSAYRANFARLRRVETGDHEPPTITYDSEVPE